ncbi:hypothetical protein [Pseudoalteromonas luteoviolacea]|uniref:Uncharacterized protein n=1 Tax=Pseudoalteromonas luteoviolacea S4054 TaxID=1129367 RepID=A0A0F6A654_9GAMM|nr:hypothetical protein [Pseudoalteromonas luteoviolacea]KKE81655.1 hypothetical protein N479_21780 [Pseudoalteromonas luteoviolacea S4054]KZN69488.1 hypothetical protein N481_22110 [Pseudoalteromonas luteoviolacea S4047-1]
MIKNTMRVITCDDLLKRVSGGSGGDQLPKKTGRARVINDNGLS